MSIATYGLANQDAARAGVTIWNHILLPHTLKTANKGVLLNICSKAVLALENRGTLITKKFGRKNNSDKRVSENLFLGKLFLLEKRRVLI